jgi:transposase
MIGTMQLIMNDEQLRTIEQIKGFLEGSKTLEFKGLSVEDKYRWTETTLLKFRYHRLKRSAKGMIRRYIERMTGYSRAQAVRLIGHYNRTGELRRRKYRRHRFPVKYTLGDMKLLAKTDKLHETLSGPATRKILQREYLEYGHQEYSNISMISVAHLYNMRMSNAYRNLNRHYTKTKPALVRIGERAKPSPEGKPGYIRIDSVHQGDLNGQKGVYHINAVDEVTQWEIVASVEKLSESYLFPVLEFMLMEFPFVLHGFHSDNGSEFVNKVVSKLLNKLIIRFTKSRPRHSNDNGLVETKNGAIIRKQLGYTYIPQKCSKMLNEFNRAFLNPYINFHRPCFFPVITIDHRGKVKRKYPLKEVMTPYERLKSLPGVAEYLAHGVTLANLDTIAGQMSDNQFAERMVQTRSDLFRQISKFDERAVRSHNGELSTYPHSPQRKKK